jgi:hypothetical protein
MAQGPSATKPGSLTPLAPHDKPFRRTARAQGLAGANGCCMTAPSPFPPRIPGPTISRRGAGVVDRGGLENRCARKRTVGSNPTLSASYVIDSRGISSFLI